MTSEEIESYLREVEAKRSAQKMITDKARRDCPNPECSCKTLVVDDVDRLIEIIRVQEAQLKIAQEEGLQWADAHDARFVELESLRSQQSAGRAAGLREAAEICSYFCEEEGDVASQAERAITARIGATPLVDETKEQL